MIGLEQDLVRVGTSVVHEPPAGVTDRVAAAMLDAVHRHHGTAPTGAPDAVSIPATRGPWRHRVRVVIAVLVGAAVLAGTVLLAAGHRQGDSTTAPAVSSPATSTADEDALTIVSADPAGAARVPVTGASPRQLATIRDVIAGLGPGAVVASVTLDDRGPRDVAHRKGQRQLTVIGAGADQVAVWLVHAAADMLVARLNHDGGAITWVTYADGGSTVDGLRPTSVGAGPAEALAAGRASLASATAAGYRAQVTVYPIGAIATVLQLAEPEFFAPRRTDWLHVAGGFDDSTIRRFVAVDAPDGTRIFSAGFGVCYACGAAHDGPAPGTPLPASMAGPTSLAVELSSVVPAKPAVRVAVDCATDSALCETVIRDRYALLQPVVSDTACAGGPGGPAVRITGTLGGVPVDTGYDNCTSAAAERWVTTLRAAGQLIGAWTTDG